MIFLHPPLLARADEVKLTPSISVEERYLDNLLFRETDRVEDLITKVIPTLEISRRNDRFDGKAFGRLERRIYARTGQLNTTDGRVQSQLQYRFTPRLNGTAEFLYAQDSQNDREIEETGILLIAKRRDRISLSLSSQCQISEKLTASIGYSYSQEDYTDAAKNDYQSNVVSADLTRDISDWFSQTVLFAKAGYSRTEYARTPVTEHDVLIFGFIPDTQRIESDERTQVENTRMTLGFHRRLTETVSFQTYAGFSSRRLEQQARQTGSYKNFPVFNPAPVHSRISGTGSGYLGNLALAYNGEKNAADFGIIHDVVDSGSSAQTLNRTRLDGLWQRRFTSKVRGSLGAQYFINKSSDDLSSTRVDQLTLNLSAELSYDHSDRLAFSLGLGHNELQDNENHSRICGNTVFFRISSTFSSLK